MAVRWLLVRASAVTLLASSLIMKLFDIPESYPRRLYRAGAMLTLIAGLAAAGMG